MDKSTGKIIKDSGQLKGKQELTKTLVIEKIEYGGTALELNFGSKYI